MTEQRKGFAVEALWVFACVALSSAWCLTAATRLSATFDEPFYVANGLKCWRTGSFKWLVDSGVMPLPAWVETAPLYAWERWRGQEFDPQADLETLLPVARATALVFWWLLLGYGWFVGRQLGGVWGGRLAIAFLAFEPTLLSNAALATTDIASAACLLAFFVHYRMGRTGGWWLRVGIPMLWFILAVLAKTSGLVFGAMGMVFFEIEQRLSERGDLLGWRARAGAILAAAFDSVTRRNVLQVFGLGLVGVFVFCGSQFLPSPSFVKWAQQQPEGLQRDLWTWTAEHLCIFSNAGNGLAYQLRRNFMKQQSFLLGESYNHSLWYFFPVSLSMKLPIALLVLPLGLAALAPRSLRNWCCIFAGMLLVFSLNCRVQLSVRYMSPLISLGCIGLAAALARAMAEAPAGWRRTVLNLSAAAAPLSMIWIVGSVWPNGLCYVNELWGGPERGYVLTCDYDWGQGLKELRAWQERSDAASLDLLYFGMDPLAQKAPFHPTSLSHGPHKIYEGLRSPYLAVATSAIYHTFDRYPANRDAIIWLRGLTPRARTSTFLIFDRRELARGLGIDVDSPRATPFVPVSATK